MTEKEAWETLRHQQARIARRGVITYVVWLTGYVAATVPSWFDSVAASTAFIPVAWGSLLVGIWWFVLRPVEKAMEGWDVAMKAEWDVPPPLMQGTVTLYDDGHGYSVGDQVSMEGHLYEVLDVQGSEIEVREVPRASGA